MYLTFAFQNSQSRSVTPISRATTFDSIFEFWSNFEKLSMWASPHTKAKALVRA